IPTSDERIMAGLANGAVIVPMWGLLLAAIVWLIQREKSEYVRQQGAQAIAWQVTQLGAFFLGMIVYAASFFLMMGGAFIMASESAGPPMLFFFPFIVFGCLFLFQLVFIVVGIWAAVRTFQGHAYVYPVIGNFVRRFLADGSGAENV
ncbi:MAG: DUF4870 domain-containing protein, partial [Anaerolineales bacterium]|nr:DUF4870 domain-containing protein [Anaerolineales bacterium]